MISIDELMEKILEAHPEVDPLEAERIAVVETENAYEMKVILNREPPEEEIVKNALNHFASDPVKQAFEIEPVEEEPDALAEVTEDATPLAIEEVKKPLESRFKLTPELYPWSLKNVRESGDKPEYFIMSDPVKRVIHRVENASGQNIMIKGPQGIGKTTTRLFLDGYFQEKRTNGRGGAISLKWTSKEAVWEALKIQFSKEIEQLYVPMLMGRFDKRIGWQDVIDPHIPTKEAGYSIGPISYNPSDEYTITASRFIGLNPNSEQAGIFKRWFKNETGITKDSKEQIIAELSLITPRIEKAMGTHIREEIIHQILADKLYFLDALLVEFPDYSRKDSKRVRKDFEDFQKFIEEVNSYRWENGEYGYHTGTNIIFFWQSEMPCADHFYPGKFDIIELEPFSPEQLVQHFMDIFGDTQCFTREGLLRIAQLARGRPRLFKRYIARCLEERSLKEVDIVGRENVDMWITSSQLIEDYTRELEPFFHNSKHQIPNAVRVLRYLQDKDEGNGVEQGTLVEEVFEGDKTRTSRMLDKLEYAGKVRRVRQGKKNKIHLLYGNQ
ncbi:MAG: hypothetical protein NWF14_00360 [Candidatus Bathyarchaeota archaeon]|nr:hypothetical protein [Candidatus Bathyarchaeota archaeon]